MFAKWIWWINYSLGGLAAVLVVWAMVIRMFSPGAIQEPESVQLGGSKEKALPQSALKIRPESYDAIGDPVITSKVILPALTLPDLRPSLTYYGTNTRPDSATGQVRLQFGLTGNQAFVVIEQGKPLYLLYDRSQTPGRYIFSPDNVPTGLWIEAMSRDNDAVVKVFLQDEYGNLIKEPRQRLEFTLQEKEFARFGGGTWELGKMRVDGTLLARQRARWYGQDEFMNKHGGAEYAFAANKERVEFGEGDERYVVYVGLNECLIWDGKRWQLSSSVQSSKTFPLLCVKKIEDRLMRLELWDVEGKGRVALNLLKSTEAWAPQVVQRDFKFVSVRTLSQYVFDIRKDRVVLRPGDWLLQGKEGWKRLVTPEEIDAYVDGRLTGILFVFNGVVKKDDGSQALSATLFNSSRSVVVPIEIPIEHAGPVLGTGSKESTAKPEAVKHSESLKPSIAPQVKEKPLERLQEKPPEVKPGESPQPVMPAAPVDIQAPGQLAPNADEVERVKQLLTPPALPIPTESQDLPPPPVISPTPPLEDLQPAPVFPRAGAFTPMSLPESLLMPTAQRLESTRLPVRPLRTKSRGGG